MVYMSQNTDVSNILRIFSEAVQVFQMLFAFYSFKNWKKKSIGVTID